MLRIVFNVKIFICIFMFNRKKTAAAHAREAKAKASNAEKDAQKAEKEAAKDQVFSLPILFSTF